MIVPAFGSTEGDESSSAQPLSCSAIAWRIASRGGQSQGAILGHNCDVGVVLTPIITKDTIALHDLNGRTLAVDGNGELYQFLALIRLRDGTPLKDSKGRITSHLSGLFYRTTRLIADHRMELVFVFDGKPPALKSAEIDRRRSIKERYDAEHTQA